MAWSDRQQQMLRAMGLRVWAPSGAPTPAEPEASTAPERQGSAAPEPKLEAFREPQHEPAQKQVHAFIDKERAQRVATLGWPALREAVAACTACGLCQSRKQTVFGVGHPKPIGWWWVKRQASKKTLRGSPLLALRASCWTTCCARFRSLVRRMMARGPRPWLSASSLPTP